MSTTHIGNHHLSRVLHVRGDSPQTRRFQTSSIRKSATVSSLPRLGLIVGLTIVTLVALIGNSDGISLVGVGIAVMAGALLMLVINKGCFPARVQHHDSLDAEPHHRRSHVPLNH